MPADRHTAAELLAQLEATEVFLRVTAANHLPLSSVLAVERRAHRFALELLDALGHTPSDFVDGTDELLHRAVHPAPADEEPTWVTYGDPGLGDDDPSGAPSASAEAEDHDAYDDYDNHDDYDDYDDSAEDAPLDITQPIPRHSTPEPAPIDFSDVGPEALVTLDEPLVELSEEDLLDDDVTRSSDRFAYEEHESEEATVVGHTRPALDEYDEFEPDPEAPELPSLEVEPIDELSSEDLSLEGFEDDEVTHVNTTIRAPSDARLVAPEDRSSAAAVRVGLPRQAPTPLPAFRAAEPAPRLRASAPQSAPSPTLALEEEHEPIAVGAVEDYEEDWDEVSVESGGSGFRVVAQEYVDEDEEWEEEEPEDFPEPPPPPPPPTPTGEELRAIFEAARAAAEAGDMQRGADLYSDVIDVEPENVDAHVGRGRLYLDLGDYTRAMSDFMVAEELAPDSPEPQIAIGDLYFARKDYRKAIEYFDAALEMTPDHAMAFCRRGISHYYRKNYVESLEDLLRAQSLDPEIPNIATYISMARKKARR